MDLKKAAFINAVGKYSVVVIQLAVNAILSRILSPEDYGILAVVTVFTTFFSTLSNMGFGTAIIQNKSLNKKDIDHIYSFSLYVAFFLSVVFALFSFVIAWFYKDGIYIPVAMLLSISLFFGTLNMVPSGVLNREKNLYPLLCVLLSYILRQQSSP
ncbi:MAG: oligosaccharide flippase family protein [Oscillospiraceae bacterium]|nr:oligosaccharide flippase family protein [Oscillospiraceae bacterium]